MKTLTSIILGASALVAGAAELPPLNTPSENTEYAGKFVWADLFTADQASAQTFYTSLFGWTATEIERTNSSGNTHVYIVLSNAGRPVAGIALRPRQMKDEIRGRWVGYVSVPDVAQTLSAATADGGKILFPAKDLPQRGTQAIFRDNEGATIGIIHSTSGDLPEYRPETGDWTWAELFASDPAAASNYYHSVIGYEAMPDSRFDRPDRFILASGGYSRASIAPLVARPHAKPGWLLYVRVASVGDTVAQAVNLGGRVLVSPKDIEPGTRLAVIADPSRAAIGIVEMADSAPASQPTTENHP